MTTCYRCTKPIAAARVIAYPHEFESKGGFVKVFHPSCYREAEYESGVALRPERREGLNR